MDSNRQEQIEQLAREVLGQARTTLIINLRFMDSAISRLGWIPLPEFLNVAVDGRNIGYDPLFVLESYKKNKRLPARQYLHMIFHCIFRHFHPPKNADPKIWDLACDIAVENAIAELNLPALDAGIGALQEQRLREIKNKVPYMTAEHLYKYFRNIGLSDEETDRLRSLFFMDDHTYWYGRHIMKNNFDQGESSDQGDSPPDQNDQGSGSSSGQGDSSGDQESTRTGMGTSLRQDEEEVLEDWKHVSENIQMDLETFQKARGDQAGSLMQNLQELNRERYDYTAFLKKFAVMGEVMRINDDEFDYIFYTYGLQTYEDIPLIEPLEYKETKRIREFVIAIDTSGSVSGSLVQTFIKKTYNILKQSESFFSRINLHIIQCDADIQEHVKITTQEEFDTYIKTMTLKGFGGTDFRPVFEFVDELIAQKEFTNLKGLIYFTDGYGTFPARQPDYQTAFVFIEEGFAIPSVPVWAIKLILRPDEV